MCLVRRRVVLRGVAGAAVAALLLGIAGSALSRPPRGDGGERDRRQIEDSQREEIRRSLGRSGDEYRSDGYRERRRMSDEERQSLRQAVRDAYGDQRDQRGRRRD